VETPPEKPKPAQSRRRLVKILVTVLVIVVVAGGSGWFYVSHLGAEAKRVYELGSTLNAFFANYTSALKKRNVAGVLDLYDAKYFSDESLLKEELIWQDETTLEIKDRVRVYAVKETDRHRFAKEDVRQQIETQLATMDYVNFAKLKIERIEDQTDSTHARLKTLLWLRGQQENGETVETHLSMRLWLTKEEGWRIAQKEFLNGTTVRGRATGFTDVTGKAGIDFKAHHNPMLLHDEQWKPKLFPIMKYAHGGVATADFDADGWYDIFFCDGEHSKLYRNLHNGEFVDVTAKAGLPDTLPGVHMALFADFNNDGYPDLFLSRSTGENKLYKNNGDATFTDVTSGANLGGLWVSTASAADYDNDGQLDLYLGRYLDPRTNIPTTIFYTRNGEGNTLLHNDGNFHFTDVTSKVTREGGLTLGLAWGDYDGDGNIDLYVANDFGRNALLKNNGDGTFSDVSKETGTLDIGYGMSATFADIDNDGRLDLYVSNVHSGQRWFGNEATLRNYIVTSFKQGTIHEDRALFEEIHGLIGNDWEGFGERVIRGNSLFLNRGKTFQDVSEEAYANPHGWYWGSVAFDYDNDGLQDIYAANGWITGNKPDDL